MADSINDGGPAFPLLVRDFDNDEAEYFYRMDGGMTLRDYFAAQSISATRPGALLTDAEVLHIAKGAYRMADAMLKARQS